MIKAIEIESENVDYYIFRAEIELELNYMTDALYKILRKQLH